jgi:hypothetical protein
MELLPPPAIRTWLLAELGELVAQRGAQGFLTDGLLEPSRRHFPDRFTRDAQGVRAIGERLLRHAGLGHLTCTVRLFTRIPEVNPLGSGHQGAIAWFSGINNGVCDFGIDVAQLDDPQLLVAAMAHEVTHAYRRHHGLEHPSPEVEEELTDLTTIFLGFGILTVNVTYRLAARMAWHPGGADLSTSHGQAGYLSAQAMSYLLAAQLVARGIEDEHQRVSKLLGNSQAACLRAALAILGTELVREELGLEGRMVTSPPAAPGGGTWVFRVRAPRRALAGVILAVALGSAGLSLLGWSLPAAVTLGLALATVASLVGLRRRDRCSAAGCRAFLPAGARRCARCGGRILAILAPAGELGAEALADAVEAERKAASLGRKGDAS